MRGVLAGTLGLALGWAAGLAPAQEVVWRAASPRPGAAPAAASAPAVSLGRPVPVSATPVQPVTFRPTFRAQSPGTPPPPPPLGTPPAPPPAGGFGGAPGNPEDPYNCGNLLGNPGQPVGSGGKHHGLFSGFGLFGTFTSSDRTLFQSDHAFDGFISPVTNPFLFEDPRALTEVRPTVIYQSVPNNNPGFRGGNLEFFGTSARVAVTERLSVTLHKLGLVATQPEDNLLGFEDGADLAEVSVGPKWTFLRSESTNTVAALGAVFEIPIGGSKVFQDTGTGSITPYLSVAQRLGKIRYGTFNAMGTAGYAFALDDERSEHLFASLHLDFDVADARVFFPFVELNYFHYTKNGTARAQDFEGRDLFNFGATDVKGRDDLSIAVGARYKFTDHFQLGAAAEFPLLNTKDLMDFRLTFDVIVRY